MNGVTCGKNVLLNLITQSRLCLSYYSIKVTHNSSTINFKNAAFYCQYAAVQWSLIVDTNSMMYSYLKAPTLHYSTALWFSRTEWESRLLYSECVYSSACIHQACQDGGADWGSAARCPCSLMAVSSIIVRAERNLAVKLETADPQNWGQ